MSVREHELREALRAVAEPVETSADLVGPSLATARRRRARSVAAGVVAALLVVGGAGVAAWPRGGERPAEVPATRTSSAPRPSTVAWAFGDTLHRGALRTTVGDGRVVRTLDDLANGGLLVGTTSPGEDTWRDYLLLDAGGTVTHRLGRGFAVASADGTTVAVQTPDRQVRLLDLRGEVLAERPVESLSLSAVAGTRVFLVSPGGTQVWDADTGGTTDVAGEVSSVSADGRTVAGATGNTDAGCWFVGTLSPDGLDPRLRRCDGGAESVTLASGGRLLGFVRQSRHVFSTLRVRDAADGRRLGEMRLRGTAVEVRDAAVEPGGTLLVSGVTDGVSLRLGAGSVLLRCTVAGDCRRVAPARPGDGDPQGRGTAPWYVVARPLVDTG